MMSWRQQGTETRAGTGAATGDDGRGCSRGDDSGGNGRWRRGRTPPRRRPAAEAGGGSGGGSGSGKSGGPGRSSSSSIHQQQQRRRGPGPSTWDLKAQRRERALWGEGVQALEALLLAEGASEGKEEKGFPWSALRAEISAVDKVLDELSTVRCATASRAQTLRPCVAWSLK